MRQQASSASAEPSPLFVGREVWFQPNNVVDVLSEEEVAAMAAAQPAADEGDDDDEEGSDASDGDED